MSDEWVWATPPGSGENDNMTDTHRINGIRRIRSGDSGYRIVLDTEHLLVYEVKYDKRYEGMLFAYVHRSLLSSPER